MPTDLIERIAEKSDISAEEVQERLESNDAEAGVAIPATEEYVEAVVAYMVEQKEALKSTREGARKAEARINVTTAADALSRDYTGVPDEIRGRVLSGLGQATELLEKELSLLNGATGPSDDGS
jgi:hypothetical protein